MNFERNFVIVMVMNSMALISFLLLLGSCSSYEVKGVDYTNPDDNRNIPRREFTK